MNFTEAAKQARKGKQIRLPYWENGAVIGVEPIRLLNGGKISRWYGFDCFGNIPQGKIIDLSSEDWEVVE